MVIVTSPWQMLIGNLAVVALFVLGWTHARHWVRDLPKPARLLLFGLVMGLGSIATMLMAAEVAPGHFVDLRVSLLTISAFFGGPLAALVSISMALAWGLVMGGAGLIPGLSGITLATLFGLGGYWLLGKQQQQNTHVFVMALATAGISVASVIISQPVDLVERLLHVGLPVALLNAMGTAVAGLVIVQARRLGAERDLLAAALAHAPDYCYVKDNQSRFIHANLAIARLYGQPDPASLVGKTDYDITSPERAAASFANEQRIRDSGLPVFDIEEHLPDQHGVMRWYCTSKVPLHDRSGAIVGLAGVLRDVTAEKQMHFELTESRDLVSYALTEMSDGLAMFGLEGRLIFCNDQYRACFPYTGAMRKPGVHISEILHAVVETGEQLSVPADASDDWIDEITGNLNRESEEEIALFDGSWLQLRTRPTGNGSTMVVVSDITRIKHAELALHSATDELKHLVRTDSLTGLLNRRAFDDAMETEIRRSARAATPLSLLIIDVDLFKSYNDHYGHPAGDECLRQVADHLNSTFKRPADIAARYGGEEFAAILPDTDEDGAYLVAEGFRRALAEARFPHAGCEGGYVTASVGVATYMPDNLNRSAAEIIVAADEMLYGAKAAGRDRVLGKRVTSRERRYAAG